MNTVAYQPTIAAKPSAIKACDYCDITVVIPTYNGAERLPRVLTQLEQQSGISDLSWEVIVCDNNSCDRTATIITRYQALWRTHVPLRYCFVPEQGAAFARQRGIVEARGEIVAFLDDDNLPAQDWLSNVYQFAKTHPQAGAFGSQIHGDFQGDLPEGFGGIACFLAIVERGNNPHLYTPQSKILPPAAGLAVRRQAWLQEVPARLFLNHKGKSAGLASEDLEAILHIQKAGWEIWYNSDMVITHHIPNARLQQDYLIALLRCVGLSRFYIRWLGTKDWRRFFKVPAYIANDLRRLAFHCLKNGLSADTLDTVTACERALLKSTVISPAFLLKKAVDDFCQNRWDIAQLPEHQQWLQRLTDAFEQGQLELYQQAVVFTDVQGSDVVKQFEILLRLPHSSSNILPASPAAFFPTAERYGLMRTLDCRVIQKVCETLRKQPCNTAIYSINLSEASLRDPSFQTFLTTQLWYGQIQPQKICFEIAESVVLSSLLEVKSLVVWMKGNGFKVVIDEVVHPVTLDGYMTQLAVDGFKLSQSVLTKNTNAVRFCWDWVQYTQGKHLQLVAKGIETPQLLQQAKDCSIAYVQGYYVSRPSPLSPYWSSSYK
ncbi:MAG: hormogonium polysaccharide biosynthesis glycosyltransferase HpsE [Cyanobacteria bacterium P01_D01_bin.156]